MTSSRNDSKDVRRYRLYIGNGNWINLDKKTTDELNEIYKAGVPACYELAPGLFIDILPNDVDCNSKNTDLSRLMRVDLHYGPDHPPSQQQQEATQQALSKYVKNLLESQGIIDAFPPLKKPDDLLPLVTSLPSHRHLSMVPAATSSNRRASRVFRSSRDEEDLGLDLTLQPLADPSSSVTSLSSLSSTTSSSGANPRRQKRNRPSSRRKSKADSKASRVKSGSSLPKTRRRTASKTSTEPVPLSSGDVTRRNSLLLDSDRNLGGGNDDQGQHQRPLGDDMEGSMLGTYYTSSAVDWPPAPPLNLDYRNAQNARARLYAHHHTTPSGAAAAPAVGPTPLESPTGVSTHHGSGVAAAVESAQWSYLHAGEHKASYDLDNLHRLDIPSSSDSFAAISYSHSSMLPYNGQQQLTHVHRSYQFPPPSCERSTMFVVAEGTNISPSNNSSSNQSSFSNMYSNSLLTHHQEHHMHSFHHQSLNDASSLLTSSPPSSSSNATTQLHYMNNQSWTSPSRDVWNMGIEGTNNDDANTGDNSDRDATNTGIDVGHYAGMQPHLDYSHHLVLSPTTHQDEGQQQNRHTSSSKSSLIIHHNSDMQMEGSNGSNNSHHDDYTNQQQQQQYDSTNSSLHSGGTSTSNAGIQLQTHTPSQSAAAAANMVIDENILSSESSPRPSSM